MDPEPPLLLSDPSYDTDAAGRVVLTAAKPDGDALALAFPAAEAAAHLNGWLISLQAIATNQSLLAGTGIDYTLIGCVMATAGNKIALVAQEDSDGAPTRALKGALNPATLKMSLFGADDDGNVIMSIAQ